MEIQLMHAKRMFLLLGIVLIGIQFIPTAITPSPVASVRGPIAAGIELPVGAILDRSCQGLPFREHAMAVV
jgi:hypothetical protein